MLRLDRVIRSWKESGALNSQINLYGFWNDQAFLTKSGDLGIVLRVRGVDYESLDQTAQEYAVKRLEAALKTFGVGFHIYQYLFKTNRPDIPFHEYEDPVIQAAVDQRKEFFREKLDRLFDVEIFYAIVIEGTRSQTGIAAAISRLPHDPRGGLQELKTQFSNDRLKVLLREQIEGDMLKLEQRVHSFVRQLSDFVQIDMLSQEECFHFLRRLLNYEAWRIEGGPESTQFLDYQVANSDVEGAGTLSGTRLEPCWRRWANISSRSATTCGTATSMSRTNICRRRRRRNVWHRTNWSTRFCRRVFCQRQT
jgi:type IV secretory pathway VirB4 component